MALVKSYSPLARPYANDAPLTHRRPPFAHCANTRRTFKALFEGLRNCCVLRSALPQTKTNPLAPALQLRDWHVSDVEPTLPMENAQAYICLGRSHGAAVSCVALATRPTNGSMSLTNDKRATDARAQPAQPPTQARASEDIDIHGRNLALKLLRTLEPNVNVQGLP